MVLCSVHIKEQIACNLGVKSLFPPISFGKEDKVSANRKLLETVYVN